MSVRRTAEGTSRLFQDYIAEYGDDMRAVSDLKARALERRRKIAEARCGNLSPPHVLEAIYKRRVSAFDLHASGQTERQ